MLGNPIFKTMAQNVFGNIASGTSGAVASTAIEYALADKKATKEYADGYRQVNPTATDDEIQKSYRNAVLKQYGVQLATTIMFAAVNGVINGVKQTYAQQDAASNYVENIQKETEIVSKRFANKFKTGAFYSAEDIMSTAEEAIEWANSVKANLDQIPYKTPEIEELYKEIDLWISTMSSIEFVGEGTGTGTNGQASSVIGITAPAAQNNMQRLVLPTAADAAKIVSHETNGTVGFQHPAITGSVASKSVANVSTPVANESLSGYNGIDNSTMMKGETVNGGQWRNLRISEGSIRDDLVGSTEQTRGMDEAAGGVRTHTSERGVAGESGESVRRFRAEAQDRDAANLTYGREVSAADFGIKDADTNAKVFLVESGETESMKAVKQMAPGYDITFFGGGNLSAGGNDRIEAACQPSTHKMYLPSDNPDYTTVQLGGHELCEGMIGNNVLDSDTAFSSIRSAAGDESTDEIITIYEALYPDKSTDDLIKEIICDCAGAMNRLKKLGETSPSMYYFSNKLESFIQIAHSVLNETTNGVFELVKSRKIKTDTQFSSATKSSLEDIHRRRNEPERNRALIPGEMKNEFYDKVKNWNEVYSYLNSRQYSPEYYDVGDTAVIITDEQIIKIKMLKNGEFSVIGVEDLIDDYERTSSENAFGNAEDGLSGERDRYGNRSNRAFEGKGNGGKSGGKSDQGKIVSERNGKSTTADYDITTEFSSEPSRDGIAKIANSIGEKSEINLKEAAEKTKTLIALHNLDEEKMLYTLGLGAFPSPSIAIVKAKDGHTMYGDATIVFPRSTIDPKTDKRNKVYGGDAWTPTHQNARVEYEVNNDAARKFDNKIFELSSKAADGAFKSSSVIRGIGVENETEMAADDIAKRLADNDSILAAYLEDTNTPFEIEYKTKEYDRYSSFLVKSSMMVKKMRTQTNVKQTGMAICATAIGQPVAVNSA